MEPQSDAVRAQSGYSALTEKQLRVSTAVGPSTRIITLYSGVSRHVASKSKAAPLQGLNQPVTDMKRLWSPAPQIISSHFPRPSSHPFHGQSFQPSASSTHRRREGKKEVRLFSSNQIHSLARPSKHSSLYFSRWPFTAARLTRPVLRLPTDLLVSQTEAASARQRPDQALPLLDYRAASSSLWAETRKIAHSALRTPRPRTTRLRATGPGHPCGLTLHTKLRVSLTHSLSSSLRTR